MGDFNTTTTSGIAERIAVVDLADELQVNKQWLFKIMKRLRIESDSRRDPERRGQSVATVTLSEADAIRHEVSTYRAGRSSFVGADGKEIDAEVGHFYVVQLEPEFDPGRIKIGFTVELEGRLNKHRCSAPFAVYAKVWPCQRSWERTAEDCVTHGLEKLRQEVYRASSIQDVIEHGDKFFAAMPDVSARTFNS